MGASWTKPGPRCAGVRYRSRATAPAAKLRSLPSLARVGGVTAQTGHTLHVKRGFLLKSAATLLALSPEDAGRRSQP
ncbi:MAG TPA: hypothetical protein ENJ82_15425 [Bacteroidetes bacterium]|nr:hypothetical protein [Bacteroidota bacterium]